MKFVLSLNIKPLFAAIEKENIDVIKLLLSTDNIDVNVINIKNIKFIYKI